MNFTPDQQKIIDARDCDLLVSAAAGSGKTAVLVERIIQLITDKDNPVDIDRFLVVTFTRAAASQMREKIAKAIATRLEADPSNSSLGRQAALVHNAQIMTIDSFCQYVLRNSFSDIDLDPGFRIADECEMKLLRGDALGELLEELYTEGSEEFLNMAESLATGSADSSLEDCILDLYHTSMSDPWPRKWIEKRAKDYCLNDEGELTGEWYKEAITNIHNYLANLVKDYNRAMKLVELPEGPYMYGDTFQNERESVERVIRWMDEKKEQNLTINLDELSAKVDLIVFDRLSPCKDKSVDSTVKDRCTAIRNAIKKDIDKLKKNYFNRSVSSHINQMERCDSVFSELCRVTLKFMDKMKSVGIEQGILSFADCEHLALNILVHPTEDGYEYTDTAREYRSHYAYVMIDEYQDSNLIQELLLSAVSGVEDGIHNRFMVGDVKQSIYRFRQADPSIFMEKYHEYECESTDKVKIDLHQNFRSRKQVLDTCNDFFTRLMSDELGDVTYDDSQALCPGAVYPMEEDEAYTSQMFIYDSDSDDELSGLQIEAKGVANQINTLKKTLQVRDEDGSEELRPIDYKDIVILLRSPLGTAGIFKEALEQNGIPVHVAGTEGYFSTAEIRGLLHFLRILVNPLQDISFYGVMNSVFGGFTTEEIALIRVLFLESIPEGEHTGEGYLYGACKYVAGLSDLPAHSMLVNQPDLADKVTDFLDMLDRYRDMSEYLTVEELLSVIIRETDYRAIVSAMRGGERRLANVDMLIRKASDFAKTSYFGLYNFLRYVDTIQKLSLDEAEAEVMDENSNVVRIMSIHKSKGLEFPVCFVSGLGKNFNKMDMKESMVIDKNLGAGIRDVDPVRRVKSNTLRRVVITERMLRDMLSEELRVLYVALTRAKEHLILTTTSSKPIEKIMNIADRVGNEIPSTGVLKSAAGFSEWIYMALASTGNAGSITTDNRDVYFPELHMNVHVVDALDLKTEELTDAIDLDLKKKELENKKNIELGVYGEYIESLYTDKYPHENLAGLYTKTSVSVLKHAAMPDEAEAQFELINAGKVEGTVETRPRFISGTTDKPGATVRGSAFHRVMELIDLVSLHNTDDAQRYKLLIEQLDQFTKEGSLSGEERQFFFAKKNIEYILNFLKSPIGERMAKAAARKELYKEAPFMMGISAAEIDSKFPVEEIVLIQGIIDVYWREGNEYVILDYKTDHVKSGERLVELYQTQLDLYKRALEKMHLSVKEKLIYSFELDEVINL